MSAGEFCVRDEAQVFHLISRCVRRTYRCRKDKRSGKDYSHRKQWIRDRLEVPAAIFGTNIAVEPAFESTGEFLVHSESPPALSPEDGGEG